jgi:hypothetical protein
MLTANLAAVSTTLYKVILFSSFLRVKARNNNDNIIFSEMPFDGKPIFTFEWQDLI